ncbi:hypothetical protein [Pseudoneobacillus sp. C159]
MSELKLRSILGDIKSKNPEKRFRAIQKLYRLDQTNHPGKELSLYLLNDVVKTAAHSFDEPVDHWDQPSYYLLEFVSEYKDVSITKSMIKYYPNFSQAGKNIVLNYLCEFDEEHCRQAILKIYEDELKTGKSVFPVSGLYDRPLWLAEILTRNSKELLTDTYRNRFYHALLFCLQKGYLNTFDTELITETLIHDYKLEREKIQEYLGTYSARSVYMSWRDNYLQLREMLSLYLSLMEYYSNDTTKSFIQEALAFKDPILQVKAVRVALLQDIPVDEAILLECAQNIETSEMLFYELIDINKQSLYPIKENKQHHFAKSHLFHHLLSETDYEDFPADIRMVEKIETENYYGQPIRFYLVSFSDNHDDPFIGWVGAYSLEAGDDNVYMWEGTYTDFKRLEDCSVEEHIQQFMEKRERRNEMSENIVYMEQKPRFSAYLQGFCAIVIIQWLGALASPKNLFILFPLTITAIVMTIMKLIERKHVLVKIEGHTLSYKTNQKTEEILLHEIESLKFSKRKIDVYSRKNQLAFTIKKKHIEEKQFIGLIQGLTDHLKEPPKIE